MSEKKGKKQKLIELNESLI
ncbi:hypothetical protein VCHENC02_4947, partial [Vibrio harveyi]